MNLRGSKDDFLSELYKVYRDKDQSTVTKRKVIWKQFDTFANP